MMRWLIYGTGALATAIGERAQAAGVEVSLAGRSHERATALAGQLDLPVEELSLDATRDPPALDPHITGVVNAAGPYSATVAPILRLCLAHGLSYVDLSNEHSTHELVWNAEERARALGVSLVPGAGFGTFAAETLASEATAALGDIRELTLILPERDAKTSMPAVQASARRILAAPPAEARAGSIHVLGPTTGIRRIDLPGGAQTVVPVRNGDLEALTRTTSFDRVQVCARIGAPTWLARFAMPLARHRARRTIARLTPESHPMTAAVSVRLPPTLRHATNASTLWAQAKLSNGSVQLIGLNTQTARSFAVETVLDVIDTINKYSPPGAHTPRQILTHQRRYPKNWQIVGPYESSP